MNVRVLPEAFDDLSSAIEYYDAQRNGLGSEFMVLFRSSVADIVRNPSLHRTLYREFRRRILKRFPYGIYYRIYEDEIIISLIFHLARNPAILRRILRTRENLG
jgi:toxin ParE1/3/4